MIYLDKHMKRYFLPLQGDNYKGIIEEEGGVSIWDAFQDSDPVGFIERRGSQFRIEYNSEDARLPVGADMDGVFSPVVIFSNAWIEEASCLAGFDHLKKLSLHLPSPDVSAYYVGLVIHGALDKEKSDYDEYDNGYVIFKHVLHREALKDFDIFRVHESPNKIFVSSFFVELFKAGGFKGVTFKEVDTH